MNFNVTPFTPAADSIEIEISEDVIGYFSADKDALVYVDIDSGIALPGGIVKGLADVAAARAKAAADFAPRPVSIPVF